MTPDSVLDFWFANPPGAPDRHRMRDIWFEQDDAFDGDVRETLGPLHYLAADGRFDEWIARPDGALALVILLDQVPRNIFRGSPRAFATDAKARACADDAIARGHDLVLTPVGRLFLYLPFEHSERMEDQERSVGLFKSIADLPDAERSLNAVLRHHEIVARFGRFPHRNAVLGRTTTSEEAAFLKEPRSSF